MRREDGEGRREGGEGMRDGREGEEGCFKYSPST